MSERVSVCECREPRRQAQQRNIYLSTYTNYYYYNALRLSNSVALGFFGSATERNKPGLPLKFLAKGVCLSTSPLTGLLGFRVRFQLSEKRTRDTNVP